MLYTCTIIQNIIRHTQGDTPLQTHVLQHPAMAKQVNFVPGNSDIPIPERTLLIPTLRNPLQRKMLIQESSAVVPMDLDEVLVSMAPPTDRRRWSPTAPTTCNTGFWQNHHAKKPRPRMRRASHGTLTLVRLWACMVKTSCIPARG